MSTYFIMFVLHTLLTGVSAHFGKAPLNVGVVVNALLALFWGGRCLLTA